MLPASTRVFTQNYRSTVSLDGSCQVLHVERLDWHSVLNIRDCASHYDYDTVTRLRNLSGQVESGPESGQNVFVSSGT